MPMIVGPLGEILKKMNQKLISNIQIEGFLRIHLDLKNLISFLLVTVFASILETLTLWILKCVL